MLSIYRKKIKFGKVKTLSRRICNPSSQLLLGFAIRRLKKRLYIGLKILIVKKRDYKSRLTGEFVGESAANATLGAGLVLLTDGVIKTANIKLPVKANVVKNSGDAAKGGSTFYRAMDSEAAETLLSTGKCRQGVKLLSHQQNHLHKTIMEHYLKLMSNPALYHN